MNISELTPIIKKLKEQYVEHYNIEDTDTDWTIFKLQEELGEFVQAYLNQTGRNRRTPESPGKAKKDTAHELADVFCFVLLVADQLDIDIEEAVKEKWFTYLK